MRFTVKSTFLIIILLILLPGLSFSSNPKREMRGVWIATVMNIDWPSRTGLSTQAQQRELTELLDLIKEWNMNTVILQVRPATDAFFPSSHEPWSQWLTGTQGVAPNPYYDPLDFAIRESRKRGLDIHLWLNPYRADTDTTRTVLSQNHPFRRNPEWFVTYGRLRYFNPGLPQTRNHVARVVGDLVRRYDFDAIHFDDYFYPYPIAGVEFPDDEAFRQHPRGFGPSQKDQWRKDNVDLIIKQLQDTIKSIKPHVEFGISPFGVWRNMSVDPRGSQTRAGASNFDDLHADILKWQSMRWIDYVAPQLYWHIGMEAADFAILAQWWAQHTFGAPLYIGHGLYRLDEQSPTDQWRTANEFSRQLHVIRSTPNIHGSIFFSAKYLRTNPLGLKERLLATHYSTVALPPINNRVKQITCEPPGRAVMLVSNNRLRLQWEGRENQKAYVVYRFRHGVPQSIENAENILTVTGENFLELPVNDSTRHDWFYYMVTALSPTNQESVPVFFEEIHAR